MRLADILIMREGIEAPGDKTEKAGINLKGTGFF